MLIIVEMTPREERVTIDGVDDSNLGTFDAIERVSDHYQSSKLTTPDSRYG